MVLKFDILAKYSFKHFSIFLLSVIVFYGFWFTNFYNVALLKIATFGTTTSILSPVWFDLRKEMNVYVYNYTNIESFMSGNESKIKIDEIGPYVYRDEAKKVILNDTGEFTVFQENITLKFSQFRSQNLKENDTIIQPNLVLLSAIPEVTQMGSFAQFGLSTALRFLKVKPFEEIEVKNFLLGYQNDFIDLALKFKKNFSPDKVGVLSHRTGVREWNVTLNPSELNAIKINSVEKKKKLSAWKSEKCNEVQGSDGFYVDAESVWKKQSLHAFLPFLCRALPLNFVREGTYFYLNLHSLVYEFPHDIYNPSSPNYCESKSSQNFSFNGLLDLSACLNVPVFLSHPHFLNGDPKLSETFEGLNPRKDKHLPIFYLSPRVGIPFGGHFRFQFNIKVSHFRDNFKEIPEDIVLPLLWIDLEMEYKDWFLFSFFCFLAKIFDYLEVLIKYGSVVGIIYSWFRILGKFLYENGYESVKMSENK